MKNKISNLSATNLILSLAILSIVTGAVWYVHSKNAKAAYFRYLNTKIASVNGVPIYQYNVVKFAPCTPNGDVLGILVDFKLLDEAAKQNHIVISQRELLRRQQNIVKSQGASSYANAAAENGRTVYGMNQQLIHAAMLQKLTMHQLPHFPKDIIHVRGILIKMGNKQTPATSQAKKLALRVQAELNSGTSLQTLVTKYSDDTISKANGGDMGLIQNLLPTKPSFGPDDLAYNYLLKDAKIGKVSSPILGNLGYWVVQIVSTSRHPVGDESDYAQLRASWRDSWLQKLEPGVMAKLRAKADIKPPLNNPTPTQNSPSIEGSTAKRLSDME